MQAFVDTSAWIAYANRRDPDHAEVRKAIHRPGLRLVTSTYIFDETVTHAKVRLGTAAALQLGEVLLGDGITLVEVGQHDAHAAWDLFSKRADKPYSFTDCTSFVVMRTLGLTDAISLDDDFRQEGFQVAP